MGGRWSTARQKPTTPEGVPTGEQRRKHNHRAAARTGDGDACRRQEEGRTQEEGRSQGRAEEGCCPQDRWPQEGSGPQGRTEEGCPQGCQKGWREEGRREKGGRSEESRTQEEGCSKGRRTQEGCGSSCSGSGIHAEWP